MDENCLVSTFHMHFELKKDVAKSVMQATPGVDPCDGVGNKNGRFETKDGYNWNYAVGSKLVYYAKKGGPAGMRNYDFKIEFKDGKPRVWVEDAEKYQSKDTIKDVADSIIRNRRYSEYCINFNGTDYYANCKAYSENIVGDIPTMVASYSTGCIVGTIGCAVAITSLSAGTLSGIGLKDAATSAITCTIAPIITAITWKFTSATETSTKYWLSETPLAFGGLLPSRFTTSVATSRVAAQRLVALRNELEMLKNVKAVLNEGPVAEVGASIKNYANSLYALVKDASEAGATGIMNEPIYKMLGFKDAKTAAKALVGTKEGAPGEIVNLMEKSLGEYRNSDEFVGAFAQAVKNSGVDEATVVKNLANRYDEVTKVVEDQLKPQISLKKQLLCGGVGAVLGTLSYYGAASITGATGLRYNKLFVMVDVPVLEAVRINTTSVSTFYNNESIEVKEI